MSGSGPNPDRLPRLCLGDSPAACLKAARRLMREAKAAAAEGDYRTAGTLEADACSTGAYLLSDSFRAGETYGFDNSIRKAWRRGTLDRMSLPELEAAEKRAEYRGGDVEKALKARRNGAKALEDFKKANAGEEAAA